MDSKINERELATYMEQLAIDKNDTEISEMIALIDQNDDHEIDKNEFLAFL